MEDLPWPCFWTMHQVWGLRMGGKRAVWSSSPLKQLSPSDCDISPCTCPKGSWPRSRRRPRVERRGKWGPWPQPTNPLPSSAPAAMMKASPLAHRMWTDSVSWASQGEGDICGPAWPWYLCYWPPPPVSCAIGHGGQMLPWDHQAESDPWQRLGPPILGEKENFRIHPKTGGNNDKSS